MVWGEGRPSGSPVVSQSSRGAGDWKQKEIQRDAWAKPVMWFLGTAVVLKPHDEFLAQGPMVSEGPSLGDHPCFPTFGECQKKGKQEQVPERWSGGTQHVVSGASIPKSHDVFLGQGSMILQGPRSGTVGCFPTFEKGRAGNKREVQEGRVAKRVM